MADTTFTFKEADGTSSTAVAQEASGILIPGLALYSSTGDLLIGQQNKDDSIPVTIAINDDVLLALGYLADAAVLDADGSINAHLRGIITILLDRLMQGQQAMADSLSVVLASDQTAIPTSSTAGTATATVLGTTADAATTTDTTGTIKSALRGLVKWAFERMPTSLGQKLMAASFPVTIASDQSAVPVSSTQLPSTLGQKAGTGSVSVVLANDDTSLTTLASILTALTTGPVPTREQRFSLKGRYTNSAVDTSGPNADIKTNTSSPPTYATSIAPATTFFGGAAINASPRYVYIPLQESGLAYDKVSLYVYSSLVTGGGTAINTVINLYAVEDSGVRELWSPLDTVTLNNDTKRGCKWSKGTGGSAVSSTLLTGAGAPSYRALDALMGPIGYLVVEVIPASDPDTGQLEIVVIRERGSN